MIPRRWIVLLAAIAAIAGTARLGWWQLDRAAQKNALQASIEARRGLPPLSLQALARSADDVPGQLHRDVILQGRWLDRHTIFLDNRPMGGRFGFVVVTPLQLDDGSAVVIERGWTARDFVDRARIAAPAVESGRVTVQGRIAERPARLYAFDGAASGPIRQNVDLVEFEREIGVPLRPLSILQTGPQPSTLLRDWPMPAAGVHTHYGYAFQWFALSALILALYVWYQLIRPRRDARA
jgi:surfeit locus 1 family protein